MVIEVSQMTMAASDPKSRELIQTVSQISNGLMGEVAKVIIGKQENLRRVAIGILSNANMLIEIIRVLQRL